MKLDLTRLFRIAGPAFDPACIDLVRQGGGATRISAREIVSGAATTRSMSPATFRPR